jgi:phospholipase A1
MNGKHVIYAAVIALFNACPALAVELTQFAECSVILVDKERLACYDSMAAGMKDKGGSGNASGRETAGDLQLHPAPSSEQAFAAKTELQAERNSSTLSSHWELNGEDKQGIFIFRPHRDNYLVATYNPSPNEDPYQPFRRLTGNDGDLSSSELAFQLSFKVKMLEEPMGMPLDVWFGYTQRSFWQAQNQEASSPFRETDYQPEVMAVIPTNVNLMGLRMRFLNLGLAHQSNGQVSTLSRSWNRAYVQAGFERGDFTLLARAWKRFNESANIDDNPAIIDYMGRGDLLGTYRWKGHQLSLLTRYNFSTDKGAAQLSWAFPLVSNLKGYVQYFSGYGYTLIDYDAYQRVLGLGVLIDFD